MVAFAVEVTGLLSPLSITKNNPSTLASPSNAADMIIISHSASDYMSAAESWATYRRSVAGGGFTIKGYDPVITGGKCLTTFMAVEAGDTPKVYPNYVEFEAVPMQGGTLCQNGKWRAFEGGGSGTTPFRVFFKDGVFRGSH